MLKIIVLGFVISALCVAIGCFAKEKIAGKKTRSQEAHARVKNGAILLDVRTTAEFAEGHPEGAINIPVDDLEKRLSELPKDKEIVTYCKSGRRSGLATETLKKAGHTVFDLGSISDW